MDGEGVFQSDLHALLAISPSKKRTVGLKAITFELTYCWYGPYSRGPIYRGLLSRGVGKNGQKFTENLEIKHGGM